MPPCRQYRAPSNDFTWAAARGARVSVKYPEQRGRAPSPFPPAAPEKFERYESNGETTLGDTLAEVIVFSGKPDVITLSARAFPALFELGDRLGSETHLILVNAGTTVETRISRERVRARNAVAASNAIVNVVGKWAAAEESR